PVAVLGPVVSRMIGEASPGSRLSVHALNPYVVDSAPESMRAHDLMVIPHGFVTGLSHRDIHEDEWVCIVDRDHEVPGGRITVEDLAELPWATAHSTPTAFTTALQQLPTQAL